MIALTVLYRALAPEMVWNDDAYLDRQVRDAFAFVGAYGCRRFTVGKVITNAPFRAQRGGEEYFRMMQMWFDTLEDAERCVFSPEMRAVDARFQDPTLFPHAHAPKGWVTSLYTEVDTFVFGPDGAPQYVSGPNADRYADLPRARQ